MQSFGKTGHIPRVTRLVSHTHLPFHKQSLCIVLQEYEC